MCFLPSSAKFRQILNNSNLLKVLSKSFLENRQLSLTSLNLKMKYIILRLFLLALSGNFSSSTHAHGRRHRDLKHVPPRIPDNSENTISATTVLKAQLSPTTLYSTSANWAPIMIDENCYDIYSNGSINEDKCSDGDEEVDACDAAYFTKVMALGLLAGAVLVG